MTEFDPDLKQAQEIYYAACGMPSQSTTPRKAPWYWRRAAKLLHDRVEVLDEAARRLRTCSACGEAVDADDAWCGCDNGGPVWESYGLFHMLSGKPQQWIEFDGNQQNLIDKLKPGQGVFGVRVTINNPKAGAILPIAPPLL